MTSARPHPSSPTRSTKQSTAIHKVLDENSEFLSAQDIHTEAVKLMQSISLATVYRTVQRMVDSGRVDSVRNEDGEQLFRRCSEVHHDHHLVCRVCGHTVEVAGQPLAQWVDTISENAGFSQVSSVIELFGVCSNCS